MKMEQTECSETSVYKIQTPGNHPKENTRHSGQGESSKSRLALIIVTLNLDIQVWKSPPKSLLWRGEPGRGGGCVGLRASKTLRAMLAGTYVPGRASQAGQAVREKPD